MTEVQKQTDRLFQAGRRLRFSAARSAAGSLRADLLLTDLHGPPLIAVTFDPNFALAPVAAGRELRIARTGGRRRIVAGRRRRRVIAGRRRRRVVGDGAADNGARGDAADDSR